MHGLGILKIPVWFTSYYPNGLSHERASASVADALPSPK